MTANLKKYSLARLNEQDKELYNVGMLPDQNKKYKDTIINTLEKIEIFSEQYKYLLTESNKLKYQLEETDFELSSIQDFIKNKISDLTIKCTDKSVNCMTEILEQNNHKLLVSNYNTLLDYTKYKGVVILLSNDEIRGLINHKQFKQLLNKNVLRINTADDNNKTSLNINDLNNIADYIDKALVKGDVLVHCRAGLSRSIVSVCVYIIKYKKELLSSIDAHTVINYVQQFRPTEVKYPLYELLSTFCSLNKQPVQPVQVEQPVQPVQVEQVEQPEIGTEVKIEENPSV
jgi:hypothetical protein